MADPQIYNRSYSFDDFQTASPRSPLPGDRVDVELDNVGYITGQIRDAIRDIRRADGSIHNYKVTFDALHPKVRAAVLGLGFDPNWVGPVYDLGEGPDDGDAPIQLEMRGMSRADLATYVGHERQIVVNTDDWVIRIMDGMTPGGRAPAPITPGDGAPISTYSAVAVATGNVRIDAVRSLAAVALDRDWVVDGLPVDHGSVVLLTGQQDKRQNRLWVFDREANVLRPADDPPVGSKLLRPVEVLIEQGSQFEGSSFELVSPLDGVVGTAEFVWQDTSLGAGAIGAGTVIAGPPVPSRGPRQAIPRRLTDGDNWPSRETILLSRGELARPALVGLHTRKVSSVVDPARPRDRRGAIAALLDESPIVVFDTPVQLGGQITSSLNNRTLVFEGQNCAITQMSTISSVFDLDGYRNVTFRGPCTIVYPQRADAAVKAVKATSGLENIYIEALHTEGVDFAFWSSAPVSGRARIGRVGVTNTATDTPIYVTNYAAQYDLVAVDGYTLAGNDTSIVSHTVIWGVSPSILSLTGTITAGRVLTLSSVNAFEGRTFRIKNASGTAFSWTVKNAAGTTLATLADGQTTRARASGGDWLLDT